mmetsp:Transcript_17621/g.56721  ORF Transcript_17621/g.56721 Transcript_17621/m.56721 type:complete len:420 (+) Transcript_17621:943-2202(+)
MPVARPLALAVLRVPRPRTHAPEADPLVEADGGERRLADGEVVVPLLLEPLQRVADEGAAAAERGEEADLGDAGPLHPVLCRVAAPLLLREQRRQRAVLVELPQPRRLRRLATARLASLARLLLALWHRRRRLGAAGALHATDRQVDLALAVAQQQRLAVERRVRLQPAAEPRGVDGEQVVERQPRARGDGARRVLPAAVGVEVRDGGVGELDARAVEQLRARVDARVEVLVQVDQLGHVHAARPRDLGQPLAAGGVAQRVDAVRLAAAQPRVGQPRRRHARLARGRVPRKVGAPGREARQRDEALQLAAGRVTHLPPPQRVVRVDPLRDVRHRHRRRARQQRERIRVTARRLVADGHQLAEGEEPLDAVVRRDKQRPLQPAGRSLDAPRIVPRGRRDALRRGRPEGSRVGEMQRGGGG